MEAVTMKRILRMGALAVMAALVLALGACGSDDDEGGSGVQVSATEFKFDPENPKVKAGKVKFVMTNDGQAPHALEIEGPSGEAETKTVNGGEKASVTVNLSKPGKYTMYCPVDNHRDLGMEGEITVNSGSASAGDGDDKKASGGGSGVSGY